MKREIAKEKKNSGPLQPLIDLVPSNFLGAASNNKNMLQVIFFNIVWNCHDINTIRKCKTSQKIF